MPIPRPVDSLGPPSHPRRRRGLALGCAAAVIGASLVFVPPATATEPDESERPLVAPPEDVPTLDPETPTTATEAPPASPVPDAQTTPMRHPDEVPATSPAPSLPPAQQTVRDDPDGSSDAMATITAPPPPDTDRPPPDRWKVRELPAARTEYSTTVEMPDGTRTASFAQDPVHYRNPDTGKLERIDSTLVEGLPGSTLGEVTNRSAPTKLRFARHADAATLVSATLPSGHHVRWSLEDAEHVPVSLGRDATDARAPPWANRDKALYPNAGRDWSLQLQARPDGVKESLVLAGSSAPRRFSFSLSLTGLTARLTRSGSISLLDDDGNAVAEIPAGFMVDASGARSDAVTYELDGSTLTVAIDDAWVSAPERTFPVVVDPTLTTTASAAAQSDDTWVQQGMNANNSGDVELKVGSPPGFSLQTAAYVQMPGLGVLYRHHVIGANFTAYQYHKGGSCAVGSPAGIYRVTQPWSGGAMTTFPGASYDGTPIDTTWFSPGDNCAGGAWVTWGNGNTTVTDLVTAWLHDGPANYGLTIRPAAGYEYDSNGWRRFLAAGTIAPPMINVTYNSFDAVYTQASPAKLPTALTAGAETIHVVNKGPESWNVGSNYALTYHLYKQDGTYVGDGPRKFISDCYGTSGNPQNIGYNEPMWCRMPVSAAAPGHYTIYFDMVLEGTAWFGGRWDLAWLDGQQVLPELAQSFSVPNMAPTITSSSVSSPTTLTPTLKVIASDPDSWPGTGLKYKFKICTGTDADSGSCRSSAKQTGASANQWQVPAGFLHWARPYYWNVDVEDGNGAIGSFNVPGRVTQVPTQPGASHNGTDPVSSPVKGVNPLNGNYVTAATDLGTSGAGPHPVVARTYNSAETRPASSLPFGAGWSSPLDMTATIDTDGSDNVVIVLPDGRQVRFGANPDGTYASPPSMAGRLTRLGTAPNQYFRLTLEDKSSYTFNSNGTLATITDPDGRTLTLAYSSGKLSSATASPSGRKLVFGWTGNHITAVLTDPVPGHTNFVGSNQPYTYTYSYDGDKLIEVCDARSYDAQTCVTKRTQYGYDAGTRLNRITEPEGNAITKVVYTSGKASTYKDGLNNTWTFAYATTNGLATTTITDPASNTQQYGYDAKSRLTTLVDENGAIRRFSYNDLGFPTQFTDENGHVTVTAYDVHGNPVRQTVNRSSGPSFATKLAGMTSPKIWWRLGETSGTDALNSASASCPTAPCSSRAGTYIGSPALNGPGALTGDTNGSVGLDGSAQYVSASNAAWNAVTGNMTAGAWVRLDPTSPAPDYQTIVAKKNPSGSATYALRIEKNKRLVYYHNNSSGPEIHDVDYRFAPGTWYFVAFVRQGTTIRLYVNGVEVLSENRTGAPQTNTAVFSAGAWPSVLGVTEQLNGSLDEVFFYDAALDEAALADLYATGTNTAYRNLIANQATAPSVWYRFGDHTSSSACNGTATVTVCDSSGNGYHGAYAGSMSDTSPGAISGDTNGATNFDGSSGYVTLPSGAVSTAGGVSIEAWVYPTAAAANQRIADLRVAAGQDQIIFGRNGSSNKLALTVYGGTNGTDAGTTLVTPPGAFPMNQWSHVVATVTPYGWGEIYRNGALVASGGVPIPRPVVRTNLHLGKSASGGDALYQGKMDEVAIYPTALPYSEISAHFVAGRASASNEAVSATSYQDVFRTPYPSAITTNSPAGYWRLGEGAGTSTAADSSGNGKTGTIDASVRRSRDGAIVKDANGSLIPTTDGPNAGPISGTGLTTPTQGFSLETWVNIPDTSRSGAFLTTGSLSDNAVAIGVGDTTLDNEGNKLIALYEGKCFLNSGINIGTGWHHVVLRVRATDGAAIFYLDGTRMVGKTNCAPGSTRNTAWSVGGYRRNVSGTIFDRRTTSISYQDAAIFNAELTDAQVREHYLVGIWANDDVRNDKVITKRDPRSASPTDPTYLTQTAYDTAGRTISTTSPATTACPSGCTATANYTTGSETAVGGGTMPTGLVRQTIDARGHATTRAYDAKGDLRQITEPVGLTTAYTYDVLGREVSITSTPGGTVTTDYDQLSRETSITAPAVTNSVSGLVHQAKTTYTYDANSRATQVQVADVGGSAQPDQTRTTQFTYDANDQPKTSKNAQNKTTSVSYDALGRVVSATDANSTVTELSYDNVGRLISTKLKDFVDDPFASGGSGTTPRDVVLEQTSYDPAGRIARVTDAKGHTIAYTYTDDDLLVRAVHLDYEKPDTSTMDVTLSENEYDLAGNLVRETTGNGAVATTMAYNAASQLISSVLDPTGLTRGRTFTYDQSGNITTQTITDGSDGETTTYTYDDANRLATSTINGHTRTITRDARGLVVADTDARGHTTDTDFDELGRPYRTRLPAVAIEENGGSPASHRPTTLNGYNTFDDVTHVSDPRGQVAVASFDTLGQLLELRAPSYTPPGGSALQPTVAYTYDSVGNQVSSTDPLGRTTTTDYDKRNRPIRITRPNVAGVGTPTTRTVYDDNDIAVQVVNANGASTTFVPDDLGRIRSATLVERVPTTQNLTTTFEHDFSGNVTKTTSPGNEVATTAYNAAGEPISTTNPRGKTSSTTYDFAGRPLTITDPLGRKTAFTYDDDGFPTATRAYDPSGALLSTTTVVPDPAGNPVQTISPNGWTTTRTFDAAGRLTALVEPTDANPANNITTTFGYDAAGNQTRITNGLGRSTTLTYNTLGLLEDRIEPATSAHPNLTDRTWKAVYDAVGQTTQVQTPGATRSYTYNALGLVTQEQGTISGGTTTTETFGYDILGRTTSASHPSGTIAISYNDRDLPIASSGPAGTAAFAYDPTGRMVSRTDAAGTATFAYTPNGLLASMTDPLTGQTETITYDDADQPIASTYGAGKASHSFTYDHLGRVTGITLKDGSNVVLDSVGYGYDANGNVTSKTLGPTGVPGVGTHTFAYDRADRLTSWTDPSSTTTNYSWDAASNRLSAGAKTATFDERNQLLTETVGSTTTSYAYTARGTLASTQVGSDPAVPTAFDGLDRMVSDGTETYSYDAFGRLATAGTATFTYAADEAEPTGDGTSVFSRDPNGNLQAYKTGSTARSAFTDDHGDVIGTFDPTANTMADLQAFDPFGSSIGSSGPTAPPLGYQGQWTDPDSGRVKMGARWYDPATGQFASRDAASLPPTSSANLNRSAYGNANPLSNTDTDGFKSKKKGNKKKGGKKNGKKGGRKAPAAGGTTLAAPYPGSGSQAGTASQALAAALAFYVSYQGTLNLLRWACGCQGLNIFGSNVEYQDIGMWPKILRTLNRAAQREMRQSMRAEGGALSYRASVAVGATTDTPGMLVIDRGGSRRSNGRRGGGGGGGGDRGPIVFFVPPAPKPTARPIDPTVAVAPWAAKALQWLMPAKGQNVQPTVGSGTDPSSSVENPTSTACSDQSRVDEILHQLLKNGADDYGCYEIGLTWQPQRTLVGNHGLTGFEALLSFSYLGSDPDPSLNRNSFMEIVLESRSLTLMWDSFTVSQFAKEVPQMRARYGAGVKLWLNVEATSMENKAFVVELRSTLAGLGENVGVEITERGPPTNAAVQGRFALGAIPVAVDDYPNGYSRQWLSEARPNKLKFDKPGVMGVDLGGPAGIEQAVTTARRLGVADFTVERVNDPRTARLFYGFGVQSGQSFELGRPATLGEGQFPTTCLWAACDAR